VTEVIDQIVQARWRWASAPVSAVSRIGELNKQLYKYVIVSLAFRGFSG